MARYPNYSKKPFSPSQNFLARDPAGSGQVIRVQGQSILDAAVQEILDRGDIVQAVDTLTEAKANDYESGIYVLTGGNTVTLDGGQAIYRVSDPGSGGIVMDNGNELVLLFVANTPANIITPFESIADLPEVNADYRVSVTGYHPSTTVGGGEFVGNASARHDGVIYFDPDRSGEIGTAAYYVDSGVDVPCWERVDKDQLTALDAGAKADNTADDQPSLQALLNVSEGKKIFIPAGTYRLNDSLASPPNTGEYGLQITGDSSGKSVLNFYISNKDGFYLSHRPADPVDYDKPGSYTGALIQRNITLENITIKNNDGTGAPAGTRTGSGLHLYFTSMVHVRNCILQGWARGLDAWCWASDFEVTRARECDIGFYYYTGTTVNFINTYSGTCQYGYVVGGDLGTGLSDNTDTPGVQNPYPPARPVGVNFIGTAADASDFYAYAINDTRSTAFYGVSSEGTGSGMFIVYKNNGPIHIDAANHTTVYSGFSSSENFIFLDNGYTDVTISNTKVDGVYDNAVIETNAVSPYLEGSQTTLSEFSDFTTGTGAGVYQAHVSYPNKVLRTQETGTITFNPDDFGYVDSIYSSAGWLISGVARNNGASNLIRFSLRVTLGGDRGGSNSVTAAFIEGQPIYGSSGGFNASAALVGNDVVVTLTATSATWDAGFTRASVALTGINRY